MALLALSLGAAASCQDDHPPRPTDTLHVSVAPLTLPGIGEAVWSVTVESASGVVWSEPALSSDRYGDGSASLSYVGPCDATANPHTVTLQLVTLKDTSDRALLAPNDYADPGPIVRTGIVCAANSDTPVTFDVTLMRPATTGFFDVAVAFEDVFCSAKLDCVDSLLNNPNTRGRARGPTAVFGFACAAGVEQETWFYLSELVLSCGTRSVHLDGRALTHDGNQGPVAPLVFEWARYRDHEDVTSDGQTLDKGFWNYAIGLDTLAMGSDTCTLTAVGTASDHRLNGLPATGSGEVIPLITWNVPVWQGGALCDNNALDALGSGVVTRYSNALSAAQRALAGTFEEFRFGVPITPNECANGEACDDGDPCTVLDHCDAAGICRPGAPVSCDDGNTCTSDACSDGHCTHAPRTGSCDDQSACTTGDHCDAGVCVGAAVICGDGNPCNGVESCDPQLGCVSGAPLACDDHDVCNGVESCDPQLGCARGTPLACADDNDCTDDTCDPIQGCQRAPHVGACNDGNACTAGDHCEGTDCVAGLPNCDDDNACTLDECTAAGCTHSDDTSAPLIVWSGIVADGSYADPVTPQVATVGPSVGPITVELDGAPFSLGTEVAAPGFHVLDGRVLGCDGQTYASTITFAIDPSAPTLRAEVEPAANAAGWHHGSVTVTFVASDDLPDGLSVTEPVTLTAAGDHQLAHGSATNAAGRTTDLDVYVNIDLVPPPITVDAPVLNQTENGIILTSSPTLVVSGTFEADDLSGFVRGKLTSNRVATRFEVDEEGPFYFEMQLQAGINELVLSASDVAGGVRAILLRVNYDTSNPQAFIQSPADGIVTSADAITVQGIAQDETIGPSTDEDVSVTVNGEEAEVENGHFVVSGVALDPGENTITAVVTDASGKSASHTIIVTREAAGGRRLRVVSGDGQVGRVADLLADPLVVVVEENGAPVADVPVLFEVTDNDGVLEADDPIAVSEDDRRVQVLTNVNGRAQIDWTLGSRSGAGINRVTITALGVSGSTSAYASGTPGDGAAIYAHEGLNQSGLVGEPYLWPLSVLVTDGMGNAVAGMPVTFQVMEGTGTFASGPTATVVSTAKGIAELVFTPGLPEGPGTQSVMAFIEGDVDGETVVLSTVQFRGSAFVTPDPVVVDGQLVPMPTTLTGIVYDENQTPIPNVRISSTPPSASAALTGADGRFTLNDVPPGFVLLDVDGASADPEAATHHLTHMTMMAQVVPGIDNQMDRPIYMLNLPLGTFVDGKEDVTLEHELLPGLALIIEKGTRITFPNGDHEGRVSVTPVSFDQAPMAPIDGLQPRLLVTIQPPGVKFDPPATLQIPNTEGLSPGQKVTMFSYDHSIDAFVTIGPGSVSSDGTVITSDPGVGVREGGWHSGTNPNPPGSASHITAHLDIVPVGRLTSRAIAGGAPGPDTTWEFCRSGDVEVGSGQSCTNQPICSVDVTPKAGKTAARGRVKVVHRSTVNGKFAQDTKDVDFCDVAPRKSKFSAQYNPTWVKEAIERAAEPLKLAGCSTTTSLSFGVDFERYEACCGGCPGVKAEAGAAALSGNAGLTVSCAIPGASFPPIDTPYATIRVGLFGEGRLSAAAKGQFEYDTCTSPIKITPSASAEIGAELALVAKLQGTVFKIDLVNVSAELNTGLKGSITAAKDTSCDPQMKITGQICWNGVNAKYNITFATVTVQEGESVLIQPKEIFGASRCVDPVPPPPGLASGPEPKCPTEPTPLPDPSCGVPTPPGGGPTSSGGAQGGSSYAGSCPTSPSGPGTPCRTNLDCDDLDVCNGVETCGADYKCVAGESLLCPLDPGYECVTTSCDPVKGCVYKENDKLCNDSVSCTKDKCVKGLGCTEVEDDAFCKDQFDCTRDYCDKIADCQHEADDFKCNDLKDCTVEHCNAAGGCEYEEHPEQCDDGVDCTDNQCKPFKGCQYVPQDTACGDSQDCTVDKCDLTAGCKHTPDDAKCDDHVDCTSDACDANLGCTFEPDAGECDDDVGCTNDTCDRVAGCKHDADVLKCNDGESCTHDKCDAVLDCQHEPDDNACDDGRQCTSDVCLPVGGCVHTELSCDDGDPCTDDACGAVCTHTPIAGCGGNGGGSSCVDSTDCTGGGAPMCNGSDVTVATCVAGRCDAQVIPCQATTPYCRNDTLYDIDCGGGCTEVVIDDCSLQGLVCRNAHCEVEQ